MAHSPGVRDRLHDHVALDEIELYAEVLIAVADTDHPLSPAEIDRVLGLTSRSLPDDPPQPPPPGDTAPGTARPDEGAPRVPDEEARRVPDPADDGPAAPGVRIVGPVPPARNGHDPTTAGLPLHNALADSTRAAHSLCGPFPPRFMPWRAWHI
ncbi:hypothetical protein [Nocardiopsis ganjiahuensis]|uniref:hypothetical protein n=1 Tax=Nocardiopsis ganjiahuensis TaxID=239984 RepID=UPI00034DF420|nr:hypothetical protein [Nocardiopsis ganjiahuensis]